MTGTEGMMMTSQLLKLCLMVSTLTVIQSMRVNPDIGTIVYPRGKINAAITKLHMVARLDSIPPVTDVTYPAPCSYLPQAEKLFLRSFDIDYPHMLDEYKKMCNTYSTVRQTALTLKRILLNNQDIDEETLSNLKPQERPRRSIGGALRRMLNIASRRQQKQLEESARNLAEELFTQKGMLQGLKYITEINSKQVEALTNASRGYGQLMDNVTRQIDRIQERVRNDQVITRHSMLWVSDAIVSGVLYNQLLSTHNELLRRRVKALGDLAQGRLSPELIRPTDLKETLSNLQRQLRVTYPNLQLSRVNVWEYYTISNVASYQHNGSIFLSIPIHVQIIDQIYTLYEIKTFIIPTDSNNPQGTLIIDFTDLIAINRDENNYFPISHAFLREHCRGSSIKSCNQIFTQYDLTRSPSCASSIFRNDVDDIQKLCKIGFVEIEPHVNPTFIDLKNSSILIVNPAKHNIYLKCRDKSRKQIIDNSPIVTVRLNCFCYLFNEEIRTAIYAGHDCVEHLTIETHSTIHHNIMYAAFMLNKTVSQIQTLSNISYYKKLPDINIPAYLDGLTVPQFHLGPIYDIKKVISLQKSGFMNTIFNKVSENTGNLQIVHKFRIIVYVITGVVIVIILGILILTCRVRFLTQLIAIGKLIKPTTAIPISQQGNTHNDTLQLSWEIMSTAIFIMAVAYWIIKHMHWCRKIYRYCAYPCQDLSVSNKSHKLQVLLYINTITNYCYIDLDTIKANPNEIQITQSNTPVTIELHDKTCASYLTILHKGLGLQVGSNINNVYTIHNTLPIPAYLKSTVRAIVAQNYEIQILVGSDNIYRSFEVKRNNVQEDN